MTDTMTDRRIIRVEAFECDSDGSNFKIVKQLIEDNVPKEYRDSVTFEMDRYGYMSGIYERPENDEEYERRIEDAKEKSQLDRKIDSRMIINIIDKYNLNYIITDDMRRQIIEAINYDE